MSEPYQPTASNRKVFFPKKSHAGYFDQTFQRKFYSEKEKRNFMNRRGFVEGDPVSKEHTKKVVDFTKWVQNEKQKNPNFEQTKEFKNQKYPD